MSIRASDLPRLTSLALVAVLAFVACVDGPARRVRTPSPNGDVTTAPTTGTPTIASPGTTGSLAVGQPAPEPTGLVRTDGRPFRIADEAGHPTLLFFGYTHCPDVCPETIATLLEVARERPEAQIRFVTVDPERDTLEFLGQWVEYLPDSVMGVTGTPDAIRRAADLYGVQYARVDTGSKAGYAMAHTASQYLIDTRGVLRHVYPFATPAEAIIGDLETLQ